jgi:hypothetical protein
MTLEWRQRRQHGRDAIGHVEAGERVAGTSTKQLTSMRKWLLKDACPRSRSLTILEMSESMLSGVVVNSLVSNSIRRS